MPLATVLTLFAIYPTFFKRKFYVRVMFATYSHIICKIVENTEELRKEYLKQGEKFVEKEFD